MQLSARQLTTGLAVTPHAPLPAPVPGTSPGADARRAEVGRRFPQPARTTNCLWPLRGGAFRAEAPRSAVPLHRSLPAASRVAPTGHYRVITAVSAGVDVSDRWLPRNRRWHKTCRKASTALPSLAAPGDAETGAGWVSRQSGGTSSGYLTTCVRWASPPSTSRQRLECQVLPRHWARETRLLPVMTRPLLRVSQEPVRPLDLSETPAPETAGRLSRCASST